MNFLELLQKRYSVRNYSTRTVEEEKLKKILEAGRLAPTAMNFQPQKIYVLKSREAIEKLRNVTRMAYNAPIALLLCYDNNISWKAHRFGDDYDSGPMDVDIVTTMMMMQATELGLGSLWVRGYCSKDIEETFELPGNIIPVCLLLLGYPAEENSVSRTTRKPLNETSVEI